MRETRLSGSEGGRFEFNRFSLPLLRKGFALPQPHMTRKPRSRGVEGIAFHAARTRRSGLKPAEKAKPFRKARGEAPCKTMIARYFGQLRSAAARCFMSNAP